MSDTTPSGLTFVGNTGACRTVSLCARHDSRGPDPHHPDDLRGPARVHGTGPIINTATVAAATTDIDPANNSATATTVVIPPSADLSITKTGDPAARPGDTISYVLTVANLGPSDAQAVVVNDPTPAGLMFVSNTGACTTPFPCSLGAACIRRDAHDHRDFYGAADCRTRPRSSTSPPSRLPRATPRRRTIRLIRHDSQRHLGPGSPTWQLTKTASTGHRRPGRGDYVRAGLATNLGPDRATEVTIMDAIPADTVFVSASPSPGGTCTTPAPGGTGTVSCVWADPTAVGPDAARSVRIVVRSRPMPPTARAF